jgi:hypothetical protein
MVTLSEATKKRIAGNQHFKCKNRPGSQIPGLETYLCPLWQLDNEFKGCFDGSTYQIDHIIEKSIGGTNNENNLQALCAICHAYKTSTFMSKKKNNTNNIENNTEEISNDYVFGFGTEKINYDDIISYKKSINEEKINYDDIISYKKSINEETISQIIIARLSVKFIYDPKVCEWYHIDKNNRYVLESRENLYLVKLISKEMPKFFKNYIDLQINNFQYKIKDAYNCLKDAKTNKERDYFQSQINNLQGKIKNINDSKIKLINFCQKINNIKKSIEMMKASLSDNMLSDKIDNVNDKLLGFNNGVYDFENNVFRKPRIDEYISKTTRYNYEEANEQDKKFLLNLFDKLFKTKQESKYVIGTRNKNTTSLHFYSRARE